MRSNEGETGLLSTYGFEVDDSWLDEEPDDEKLDDEEGGDDDVGPPPEAGDPDDWEDGVEADDFVGEFWNDTSESIDWNEGP